MTRSIGMVRLPTVAAFALVALFLGGCGKKGDGPALSKTGAATSAAPLNVPVPPANGPKLGAIAYSALVVDRPAADGKPIGYLHAGAQVPRAEAVIGKEGCPGGWFPIRPRGFVCAGATASTDLAHPTLKAMALQPKLEDALPYTYGRAAKDTLLFKRGTRNDRSVDEAGKLLKGTGMAVVGSWQAAEPGGASLSLGMLTDGTFVRTEELEQAKASDFSGVEIGKDHALPIAFVVKQGVRAWKLKKLEAKRDKALDFHSILKLTGKFRTVEKEKYWALEDGRHVRHKDVTIITKRSSFPEWATADQRWIDISLVTGALVLYEGKRALYATLASVGRDRLSQEPNAFVTKVGDFEVTGKQVTLTKLEKSAALPIEQHDVPWVLELSSGQAIHGAYWHSRFGIETGPGGVQLSPKDAQHIFAWATPELPEGWHGVSQSAPDEAKTRVRIRK